MPPPHPAAVLRSFRRVTPPSVSARRRAPPPHRCQSPAIRRFRPPLGQRLSGSISPQAVSSDTSAHVPRVPQASVVVRVYFLKKRHGVRPSRRPCAGEVFRGQGSSLQNPRRRSISAPVRIPRIVGGGEVDTMRRLESPSIAWCPNWSPRPGSRWRSGWAAFNSGLLDYPCRPA